jgi:tRNA A37 methylthiotransferase MiaB
MHAFPFSAHLKAEKVPASDFKNQISEKIKKERLRKTIKI